MHKAALPMILVLLSVIVLCPLVICPSLDNASHSCCHHPAPKVLNCPYSILQKSQTKAPLDHGPWLVSAIQTDDIVPPSSDGQTVVTTSRLVNDSGLYLLHRVLLI